MIRTRLLTSTVRGRAFISHVPASFQTARIQTHLTTQPKAIPPNDTLVFGRTFSDHMFLADWDVEGGWSGERIVPYGKIALEPSAAVFHYAFEAFEGMKAYKDAQGNVRLFRPDMNMDRFAASCDVLALPVVPQNELLGALKKLVKLEQRWIPAQHGYSLYLRPTMIGTQEFLGVAPSTRAMLFIIAGPVGPYYRTGFNAVKLWAQTERVRAWPGGVGDCKVGGNYAPTVKAQQEAAKQGYQQNLWLFGSDHELTEVGTMNLFVYWKNKQGEVELITPPLDGMILPGVTRDSILALTREWNEFKVTEGKVTMSEVTQAVQEGRMMEMFGAGTACIVSPVNGIRYMDKDIAIPLDPLDGNKQAGPLASRLNDLLLKIQYGQVESEWSVVV